LGTQKKSPYISHKTFFGAKREVIKKKRGLKIKRKEGKKKKEREGQRNKQEESKRHTRS
jgi:hypothetical protein